jgi:TolB protein
MTRLVTFLATALVGAILALPALGSQSSGELIALGLGTHRNFDVWLVATDGTRVRRLTTDPGIDTAPTWSPDGSQVAYLARFDDSSMEAQGIGGALGAIDFGPLGHYRNGGGELCVVGADGTGRRVLVGTMPAAAPAWSPDGTRIAFARPDQGIYVVRADGTGLKRLSSGGHDYPAWSPDGRTIAYSSNAGIWVMRADGSHKRRLTSVGDDLGSSWSPDGTWIAFTRFVDTGREVWVMHADGSGMRRLSASPGGVIDPNLSMDPAPAWSPDGSRLAFDVASKSGASSIGVIGSDGTGLHVYPHNHDGDFHPEWSPDGTTLTVTSWMSNGEGLGILAVDSKGPPRIVLSGYNTVPTWQPA